MEQKETRQRIRLLMVGVGPKCIGGMWSVAKSYIDSTKLNDVADITYIPTATMGSIVWRIMYMGIGYLRILWQLLMHRPELVHIHMAEKGSVYRKGIVVKWSKAFGCKVIIHMHAGPFMHWYDTRNEKQQKWIREMLNRADKILMLGKYWETSMEAILPKEKMEVLYNGVQIPEERLYNSKARNIVYFGVINRDKGVPELLQAMKMLDDRLEKDVKLFLYGKDLEGNLEEQIDRLQINDRVIYKGWIGPEQRDLALRNAMLSVLPSHFEGLSMSVIEAMSYGVPVVTTNISTMPELLGQDISLVEVGNAGMLADEIEKYCKDEQLREVCSEKLYQRAKMYFNLNGTIEQLAGIWMNMVKLV